MCLDVRVCVKWQGATELTPEDLQSIGSVVSLSVRQWNMLSFFSSCVKKRKELSTSLCVFSQILLIIGVFSGYTLI